MLREIFLYHGPVATQNIGRRLLHKIDSGRMVHNYGDVKSCVRFIETSLIADRYMPNELPLWQKWVDSVVSFFGFNKALLHKS